MDQVSRARRGPDQPVLESPGAAIIRVAIAVNRARKFRVFLSSTFSDFTGERNALHRFVFPRLRDLALRHDARFQAIDLRWGVRDEAALDQRTMPICLSQIERCRQSTPRPNFVALVGDRLGWRPVPYALRAEDYHALRERAPPAILSLLEAWYQRDDNAVPPENVLQPRQRGTRFEDQRTWATEVEGPLVRFLEENAIALGPGSCDLHLGSAVAQEIRHALHGSEEPVRHAFAFIRSIRNFQDVVSALPSPGAADLLDMDERHAHDLEAHAKVKALQSDLVDVLGVNASCFEARWTGSSLGSDHLGSLPEGLDACLSVLEREPTSLCEAVWVALAKSMREECLTIGDVAEGTEEAMAQSRFRRERTLAFTGRETELAAIVSHATVRPGYPLLVHGQSGSGKSALLARALAVLETLPRARVVYRFIGATAESSVGSIVLAGVCREIRARYGEPEVVVPGDYPRLIDAFQEALKLPSQEAPLILVVDALDAFAPEDPAGDLKWIPASTPESLAIIVSGTPSTRLQSLATRIRANRTGRVPDSLRIDSMSTAEASQLIDDSLLKAGRVLQSQQRATILECLGRTGLPLHARLLAEEARAWHSYTDLPPVGDSKESAVDGLLRRLCADDVHGKVLVARSLGYLRCSRHGLTEEELLDLFSMDTPLMAEVREHAHHALPEESSPRFPVAMWIRLFEEVRPYLGERSADGQRVLSFFHAQLDEGVDRVLLTEELRTELHGNLAAYFAGQPLRFGETPNRRKLSEQAYQAVHGTGGGPLEEALWNLEHLESKCLHQGISAARLDCGMAVRLGPGRTVPQDDVEALNSLSMALRLAAGRDLVDRGQIRSQLFGRLQLTQHPRIRGLRQQALEAGGMIWVASRGEGLTQAGGTLLATIEQPCRHLAISADGRYLGMSGYDSFHGVWDLHTGARVPLPVHEFAEIRRVFSAHHATRFVFVSDRVLGLFDVESGAIHKLLSGTGFGGVMVDATPGGRLLAFALRRSSDVAIWSMDVQRLQWIRTGGDHGITALRLDPTGRFLFAGTSDGDLRMHEVASGEEAAVFRGHSEKINAIDIDQAGTRAATVAHDWSVRLWNLVDLRPAAVYEPTKKILAGEYDTVVFTNDSSAVIVPDGFGDLLRIDARTGELETRTSGHVHSVTSLALPLAGVPLVSASTDDTVKVWDVARMAATSTELPHRDRIGAMSISSDGAWLLTGSNDYQMKLWKPHSLEECRCMPHTTSVNAVAMSADGRIGVSGAGDAVLRIWDLESGRELGRLTGHPTMVTGVLLLADDETVVSATGGDEVILVWNVRAGCRPYPLLGHARAIQCLGTDETRRLVLSGAYDETIRIWDVHRGIPRATLKWPGHVPSTLCVAGDRVLAGSDKGRIAIWDLKTQTLLRTLDAHTREVSAVLDVPSIDAIVSSSWDASIKVWNRRTLAPIAEFRADAQIRSCVASSDGALIAGDDKGSLYRLSVQCPG